VDAVIVTVVVLVVAALLGLSDGGMTMMMVREGGDKEGLR
jgi:hypothetical protein